MVYLLFGAIFSYIILYIWFPVFFYINYNFENTLASLGTRFTTDNFKDASLITGSPEVIIAVGIIVMLFILYQGVNSKIYLVYIEIVYLGLILVPVVLHQVQSNSMYVFHCAVLLSYYIGERKKEFLNNSSHLSTKK